MKKDEGLVLPPGFRFHPTDEELVKHYLCRKCAGHTISVPIIADIDLYKFDPWQLPGMGVYGEKEWYFFTPRDRKYPNGSRPNRAAGTGYWKATGADKAVVGMGIKKALVFYAGKPPTGFKTNWIMHEYRLANVDRSSSANKRNNLRLDDWVLCRIYNKKGTIEKHYNNNVVVDQKAITEVEDEKPKLTTTFLHQPLPPPSPLHTINDYMHHFDTSTCESVPRLMHTASHLQVLSAEFPCEIQSAPKWNDNLDYHHQLNYMDDDDGFQDYPFSSQMQQQYNNDQLQDMFMYMHKPF